MLEVISERDIGGMGREWGRFKVPGMIWTVYTLAAVVLCGRIQNLHFGYKYQFCVVIHFGEREIALCVFKWGKVGKT